MSPGPADPATITGLARKQQKRTEFIRLMMRLQGTVLSAVVAAILIGAAGATAGESVIVKLKDFTQVEVKAGGFRLPGDTRIHVRAIGGGREKALSFSKTEMYAYGWILNADSRQTVWRMGLDNSWKDGDFRKLDDTISLPRGAYEVYFAAYGILSGSKFSVLNYNIDRRTSDPEYRDRKRRGWFDWIGDLFGDDVEREWKKLGKEWGIELAVDDRYKQITMFNAPLETPNSVFQAVRLGEGEHVRQPFSVSRTVKLRIYALGEMDYSNHPADYGWIVDAKTRKRIWEMRRSNVHPAGGADKNIKFDEAVEFQPGEYTLYFTTDDSHSYLDWNSPPPEDPFSYGVTMLALRPGDKDAVKLLSSVAEERNIIVSLTRVGNDESRKAAFSLKVPSQVRVYALGERNLSHHQMADYGWIMNTRTREKVWTLDVDRTENAGGDEKNRIVDEVISLPAGDYTVYYQTDDSHAYSEWNASPPFDPEHWGITVYGAGEKFDMNIVEKNAHPHAGNVLAQIVEVGDHAERQTSFTVSQPTHVRVYAIGEGQGREMYDYGWIENAGSGRAVWEMTYAMTFHAGGGRKNRMVNTTMTLEKGEYVLHYVSDDSHSFGHWNTDPPDDPTMWGITVFNEDR